MALLGLLGEGLLLLACGLFSALIWQQCPQWLVLNIEVEIACHLFAFLGLLLALTEVAQLPLPFYPLHQRSTYGSSRWADPLWLGDLHLARRKGESLQRGELYEQTTFCFEHVYRIDLQHPERSDRWNFLPACKHNAELAHEAAAIILHVDQYKNSSADPFWKEAETAALTAIILHLAQWHERPTPAMIQEMVSQYLLAELNDLMRSSADPKVPLYWGMFTKVEPKLQGGVLIGLGVRCAAFNIPNAKAISSPITVTEHAKA